MPGTWKPSVVDHNVRPLFADQPRTFGTDDTLEGLRQDKVSSR